MACLKEDEMLRLIQKNAFYFTLNTVVILTLMTVYWFTARNELSWGMVLFQGLWMILIVEGSISSNEKAEEKSNGYKLLRILPVGDREIVISKFILVLSTVVFVLAYNYILYFFIPGSSHLYALGRFHVFLCLFISLFLAGLSYIIIFRFGNAVFLKFVWIATITIIVTPILLIELVLLKMDIDFRSFIDQIARLNGLIWVTIGLSGLGVYFLMMQVAIKAKQASRG